MTRRTAAMSPETITRYGARVFDDKRDDPYLATGKYREATRHGVWGLYIAMALGANGRRAALARPPTQRARRADAQPIGCRRGA